MHIARQAGSISYVSTVLPTYNQLGMWTARKRKEICDDDNHGSKIFNGGYFMVRWQKHTNRNRKFNCLQMLPAKKSQSLPM